MLYIIGNGFDRHHGILSGYEHFKKFVQRHDPDLFKSVGAYLPAGDEWSDLEIALASLDVDNIISDLEHFMPSYGADDWSDAGHHDFQYEVERVAECLSTTLKRRFVDWIRQVLMDLSRLETRERLSQSAIDGFFAIMDKWQIPIERAGELLGGMPRSTVYKLKSAAGTLRQDELTRISYIVGIYKALHILCPTT
jgi:hypothetical protein